MGDRGNIAVLQHGKTAQVWFYSHWNGTELPDVLRTALARRQRWSDGAYLARIIFCEMVKGNEDEEDGFGISTAIGDNQHDILVCDVPNQRVYKLAKNQLNHGRVPNGWAPANAWAFEEFISLKQVEE